MRVSDFPQFYFLTPLQTSCNGHLLLALGQESVSNWKKVRWKLRWFANIILNIAAFLNIKEIMSHMTTMLSKRLKLLSEFSMGILSAWIN